MAEAAELGTKKIMEEHCSIGIIVTTDGSVTDIQRQEYLEAETKAIEDMQATGKPFLIVINTSNPDGQEANVLRGNLEERWDVPCICINVLSMQEKEITEVLSNLLYMFPVTQLMVSFPGWMQTLPDGHELKTTLYGEILNTARKMTNLRDAKSVLMRLNELEALEELRITSVDPGCGAVSCVMMFPEKLFYQIYDLWRYSKM